MEADSPERDVAVNASVNLNNFLHRSESSSSSALTVASASSSIFAPTTPNSIDEKRSDAANRNPVEECVSNDEADEESKNPDCGWQGTLSTVKSRIAHLFNNRLQSDVQFDVGKGDSRRVFHAHTFILSIGSSVFDTMFNGPMAIYAGNNSPLDIAVPDVEPAAFEALLKLLYTDKAEITPNSVMSTLYTAKKYAVPSLENHCVNFLKTNLRPDNAFLLLTQARLFDEKPLVDLCLHCIDQQTSESLDAESFYEIDHDTLCAVVERDSLQVREAKIFASVYQWSQAECERRGLEPSAENRRNVLGRALNLLRFPIMTLEEFANGPARSGVLTDREVVNLFLYFTVNPKPQIDFLDVPRNCLTGKEHSVTRFTRVDRRWGYSTASDRIRFTVDRSIFIVGLGLYGSVHGSADYEALMEIIHIETQRSLAQHKTAFTSDGSSSTFRVMFQRPVPIQPSQQYIISVTITGPDSFYGTSGNHRVVKQFSSEGHVVFTFFYSPGNNNGTSVEDGQIPEILFCLAGGSGASDASRHCTDRPRARSSGVNGNGLILGRATAGNVAASLASNE